ncbi:hypothetical protein [Pseudomonas orientalis]|uniref:Uncharacterized protein n=1 Tax=Pseudomonas orientalis TaxID=76758 RepID=A0A4Q7D2Y8_9PSED|nr:hypothetical protein [Pseudomonas orientalis]RZI32278.1 hypothetical protein EUX57_07920 [Pseudomonas orientalis]
MSKPIRNGTEMADITRLEQANETMRLVNRALARNDVAVLTALGFCHQHIGELQQQGGFRSSSIAQNTRMITRLRKVGDTHVQ